MAVNDDLGKAATLMIDAVSASRPPRPHAPIGTKADDFNRLLQRGRSAYADSRLLKDLAPLQSSQSLIVLVSRLALFKGAVDAAVLANPPHPGG